MVNILATADVSNYRLPQEEICVAKKEVVMLMIVTIVSICLGNLGTDLMRSALKSLSKNYQQFQQEHRTRLIARLRKNLLHSGPQT